MEVKSYAVKNNISQELESQFHELRQIGSGQTGEGKSEHQYFRNQGTIVLGCNLKNNRMISGHFQGKPFEITVIQVYAPNSNAEVAQVEWFYEDLQDLQN